MEFQTWNQTASLADDEGGLPVGPGSWHLRLIDELQNLGADGWEVLTFHHAFTLDRSGRETEAGTDGSPVVEYQGVLRRMSPDQTWEYRVETVRETDEARPDLLEVLHVGIEDLWIACGYAATPHREPARQLDGAAPRAGIDHWFLFKRHRPNR